jgi:hypothetical protein
MFENAVFRKFGYKFWTCHLPAWCQVNYSLSILVTFLCDKIPDINNSNKKDLFQLMVSESSVYDCLAPGTCEGGGCAQEVVGRGWGRKERGEGARIRYGLSDYFLQPGPTFHSFQNLPK